MIASSILQDLALARRIADHANLLGVHKSPIPFREPYDHLGAVLADAILQAGVSYISVVRSRVDRIYSMFPEAKTLPGLIHVLDNRGAANFLLWNHSTKLLRFTSLVQFVVSQHITNVSEFQHLLSQEKTKQNLLQLNGIGLKTYDYLCCLVGLDCIAVDRHIKTFASEAGVPVGDYERLKLIVSHAADLLELTRRDFDSWIWKAVSERTKESGQISLF